MAVNDSDRLLRRALGRDLQTASLRLLLYGLVISAILAIVLAVAT